VFTIGPFSRLAGVSAKVLRSYDELGLFRPVWTDQASAYRYYSPSQLPELRRILMLRELGIGLAEIARLVDGRRDLAAALDARRDELERERRAIDRRLAALDIRFEMDRTASPIDVVVRPLPAEPVATLRVAAGGDVEAAFYELEVRVRDLRRRANRPPGAILFDDGTAEIFVPVRGSLPTDDRIGFRRLEACRAATVLERGPYGRMGTAQARLERWIGSAGYRRAGETRVIYLQFGAEPELRLPRAYLVDRSTDFVTELQVPIA
jgi:DNA-binding transcriptional MerR regulator